MTELKLLAVLILACMQGNVGVHGNGYSFVFTWGMKQQQLKKTDSEHYIQVFKCVEDCNMVLMNVTNEELSLGTFSWRAIQW